MARYVPKALRVEPLYTCEGRVYRVDDKLGDDGKKLSGNPHWWEYEVLLRCKCGRVVSAWDSLGEPGQTQLNYYQARSALAAVKADVREGDWSKWFLLSGRCECRKAVMKGGGNVQPVKMP